MIKKFTCIRLFLFIFSIAISTLAIGQCNINSTWTFSPSPVDGVLEAGETIEVCVTLTGYSSGGANWMWGFGIDFHPAWDLSTINVTQTPASCSGNGGAYLFMEDLDCNPPSPPNNLPMPITGFFYDSPIAGPFDGNPCNNWGDPCFGAGSNWEMCFEITLTGGGPGNPYDGQDITPSLIVYGDVYATSWSVPTGCPPGSEVTGPGTPITLNACDAESGTSPGTLLICENGTFNLITELGAPLDLGGTWTGPAGWAGAGTSNGPFNPLVDGPGEYTYTVLGTDACTNSSTIEMEYNNLGTLAFPGYCAAADIALSSFWPTAAGSPPYLPGGTWTNPNGIVDVDGILEPSIGPAGNWVYTFYNGGNCLTTATINVTLPSGGGSVGTPCTIDVCTTDAPFALLNVACFGASPGGQWLQMNMGPPQTFQAYFPQSNVTINPATLNDNTLFIYALGSPPCIPLTAELTVMVHEPVNSGTYTEATVCETDPPFLLESLLNGNPDPGLQWATAGGTVIPNLFDPSTATLNTVYNLQYSGGLAGTSCFSGSIMLLTVTPADADAGDNNSITVCATDPPFEMNGFLNGTPQGGGTWSSTTGPHAGTFFVPGQDPGGTYTYDVSTNCGDDQAFLIITVLPGTNPGISGTLSICNNATNIPLAQGLGGTPAVGGTWSLGGTPVGPTVNGNAVTNGAVYTYTTGTAPCQQTSTVTIALTNAPFAGTAIATPQLYCNTDPSVNLFTLLATPPSSTTGAWSGPGGYSGVTLNPATALTGNYTYTLTSAICGTDTETIFITIETAPNAGNNATVNVCPNGTASVNLFTSLGTGVATGGTWLAPPGGPTNGTYNPGNPTGVYTYTVASPSGLCTDAATITIQSTTLPNPGTNGNITVCAADPAFPLNTILGGTPAGSGFWLNPSNGLVPGGFNAQFTPGTSAPGTYTYAIAAGGCPAVSSTVVVNVLPEPNPGTNASVALCASAGTVNLISYLGGSPAGTGQWFQGGAPVGATFDVSGLGGTSQTFNYTVDNGVCSNTATLTINIENQPNAGPDVSVSLCGTGGTLNLLSLLDPAATTGGSFTGGNTIPHVSASSGTYTYVVSGNQCPNDNAVYTLTIDNALSTSALSTNCTASQTTYTVSFTISGGNGVYTVNGTPSGINFTSAPIPAGTNYNFTVSDGGPCGDISVSGASPTCSCPATAAFVGGNQTICAGSSTALELDLSGNAPFTVVYSIGGVNQPPLTGLNDGDQITVSPSSTTSYTLVSVEDANCVGQASGTITVNVETPPNAGPDVTTSFCATNAPLNLLTILNAGANSGGSFIGGNTITVNSAASGNYTYEVTGNVCADDNAIYTLNIVDQISTTAPSALCNAAQTSYTVSFTISGGNGTYSVNGTSSGAVYTSAPIPTGTPYNFTVADGSSCADLVVNGNSPNCSCPATASFSGTNQTICAGESADLIFDLSGAAPFTVIYSIGGVNQAALTGLNDGDILTVSPTSTTTYSLVSVNDFNCTGNASGSITVNVEAPVNAGPDVTTNFCATNAPLNLLTILNAGANTGGSFIGGNTITLNSAASGNYNYEVTGNVCADDNAIYTLNIVDQIATTAPSALCNAAQTTYTVSFTMSGGNGTYSVNGSPSGAVYTSAPIPTGTPYNFTVADGSSCADLVVNGNSPNCSCAATASFSGGNQTICAGESADIGLVLSGSAPFTVVYSIGGVNQPQLTGLNNGDVLTVSPTTTSTFTLVSVNDQNCTGNASGAVTVTVETPPNAGPDVNLEYCATGSPLNLFSVLNTGAGTGGSFSPSNNIVVNAAASGTYTYTLSGNQCPNDQALYNISIDPPLTTSNLSAFCTAAQTDYVVTFTISGGDGNYTVSGMPGTLAGNTFTSTPIPSGDAYAFTVSDAGLCANVTLSGPSPSCNCTAQASITGTTTICAGTCATLTFVLQGNGPFNVVYQNSTDPLNPVSLSGIFNGHTISVCPTTVATYTILDVSDMNCTGIITGSPVQVSVNPPVVVSNIQEVSDNIAENYTVSFNISGGSGSYFVLPAGGTISAGVYTSALIPCGQSYSFSADDSGPCPAITVSGSYECECISEAGTITNGPLSLCQNESALVTNDGTSVLDGNDILQYVLHNGTANTLGTVLATSNTGTFNYQPSLIYGETYYISMVVGNQNSLGNVTINHTCTSASNGIPVVFNALPTASISGAAQVCPGEAVDLIVSFSGEGPFDFVYAIDGNEEPAAFTSGGSYTITTTQPGIYTVTEISDNNCFGSGFGQASVSNFAIPTATMGGNPDVCQYSGNGPQVSLTGSSPWTLSYSIDGDVQPSITTSSSLYTIPADTSGLYELVSLTGPNCSGAVSGSLSVTIVPAPTASLTGGGSACAGDQLAFDIVLTGQGPWNIQYSIDGVAQQPLNVTNPNYTFLSAIDGDYNIVNVSDQNCSSLGFGLSSLAAASINPLPTAEITTNYNIMCIGQELELGFNLQGTAPFNIVYLINGDTLSVNGVPNGYTHTFQPEVPVVAELIYVQGSAIPACSSTPNISAFVQVSALPNAPVLHDRGFCSGSGPVAIGVSAVPGMSYSWSPSTGLSDPNIANPTVELVNNGYSSDKYAYVLSASNGECTATDTAYITVNPGPKPYFTFSPQTISSEDPTVYFNNMTGDNETLFYWTFDSLETSESRSPVFKFPDGVISEYQVTLQATNPLTGCVGEYTAIVPVKAEMLLYIPNAFTPDGDGLNDLWGPVMKNVDGDNYRLTIFDRFGEIVFQTLDVDQKWNGGMNGSAYYVQTGVYVWLIETKNKLSLEEFELKGQVTVVR